MVVAEVMDKAAAFRPKPQEKIFELYYTTKSDKGGSGSAWRNLPIMQVALRFSGIRFHRWSGTTSACDCPPPP